MQWSTFNIDGTSYAVVPVEDLARHGLVPDRDAAKRKRLGARLRAARDEAGLTQAELAERMGKSQPMVSAAEQGRYVVGQRYMSAVLAACGLPLGWTPKTKRAKRKGAE